MYGTGECVAPGVGHRVERVVVAQGDGRGGVRRGVHRVHLGAYVRREGGRAERVPHCSGRGRKAAAGNLDDADGGVQVPGPGAAPGCSRALRNWSAGIIGERDEGSCGMDSLGARSSAHPVYVTS